MPTVQEVEITLEDYLFNMISTAATGSGVLAVQTNPSGSKGATGIQNVRRSTPPEANVFPSVGVEFKTYTNDPVGTRTDEMVMHFDIVISMAVAATDTTADTREAARLALRNYVNDGSGNGMSPLLRSDRTLGGNCTACWIESLTYGVEDGSSSSAGTIAWAWYKFAAKARVRW